MIFLATNCEKNIKMEQKQFIFLKKFFMKMMKMFYVMERKTLKLGFEKEQ